MHEQIKRSQQPWLGFSLVRAAAGQIARTGSLPAPKPTNRNA